MTHDSERTPDRAARAKERTRDEAPAESGVVPAWVRAGDLIGGRYVAVAPLASGGMGSLWEVHHHTLGTRLALKLLHDGAGSAEITQARFEREARTAASIQHPNVVEVVDYHIDDTLGPYLVMELLEGESLHDAIDAQDRLSLPEVVSWLEPVARALDALHERDLLHRDVKPANIMRVKAEGGDVVKLVDFGLAIRRDGRDRVTRKGMLLGTPDYVAPEVATGKGESPSSDIYALAVTAYEALIGDVPFTGNSPMAVLAAKASPAPPLQTPTGLLFSLPVQLAFAAALSPDPKKRPIDAMAFIRSLLGS